MGRGAHAPPATALAWSRALVACALVVVVDQMIKQAVVANVDRGDPMEVIFGVKVSNVRNSGIAFGLLEGAGDVIVLTLTLGAMGLLLAYFAVHALRPGLWLAVGLVVGGALGNLADRIRIGAAIDFIDPPLWPAFNMADVSIVAGVSILVVSLLAPQGEHAAGA
jgi:signal peptidase II